LPPAATASVASGPSPNVLFPPRILAVFLLRLKVERELGDCVILPARIEVPAPGFASISVPWMRLLAPTGKRNVKP
jgi:hypothetical protein